MAACSRPIDVFVKSIGKGVLVPCSRCAECLERKRQQWLLRAQYEMQAWRYCYFVTLSYNDDYLPYESFSQKRSGYPVNPIATGESVLCPYDLRKFFERFRIISQGRFSYFACGEYGSEDNTKRPHYHICLYCDTDWQTTLMNVRRAWSYLRPETSSERYHRYKLSKKLGKTIKRDAWNMRNRIPIGRDQVRCLSYKRITYVSKYVTKQISSSEVVPPFYRSSNGLGKCFLDSIECKMLKQSNQHFAYLQSGLPCALPRYFSQKMFTLKQMEDFQMKMIFRDSLPFTPDEFSSEQDYYESAKTFYKTKQFRESSARRRRLLRFQGVHLL